MHDIANPLIIDELTKLAERNKGILLPEKVVKAAEPRDSILHKYFTWDNSEAARQYRLDQARNLIRVTVRYIEVEGERQSVRVFTSLTHDRNNGRGYRTMVSVLSDKELRRRLIEDALEELQRFEKKYNHLRELSAIFATNKKVADQLRRAWAKAA